LGACHGRISRQDLTKRGRAQSGQKLASVACENPACHQADADHF
jgi:hypothetical protein